MFTIRGENLPMPRQQPERYDETTPDGVAALQGATRRERRPRIKGQEARVQKKQRPVPPHHAASPRRGCWATCAFFAGASLLVMTLVIACMIAAVTLKLSDFASEPIDNFLAFFGFDNNTAPAVVDSRTVVLDIKDLALLETVQSGILLTKTVVDSSAVPDAELQISYVGTVKAGIDLAGITADHIVVEGNAVTVTLPPPRITQCDLGKPEIHYWECRGWAGLQNCGSRYTRLQSEAYDRALDDLLETAQELGLLDLAMENAQRVLYDLLTGLGFGRVDFQTQLADIPPDESCFSNVRAQ